MNIELMLNALEKIVEKIGKTKGFDRLALYTSFNSIVSELTEYVEDPDNDHMRDNGAIQGNYHVYVAEMDTPLKCLAGLERTGHDDSQNIIWVNLGIRKLRSMHCFNVA